ncbi:putative defensin-like protein 179 [Vicia villosa]|uniref:putative defensin-like protein 179 n=1 Tax=Vicia villosa TaxID=3911 RepID=UPI00273CF319|nr:putative defensin-like protein 179 [Vicia villosa]
MANQMSKSFCFFAILVLVLAVQIIEIECGECSQILGKCGEVEDCTTRCNSYASGVRVLKASCSFLNLCTCSFDRPPPKLAAPPCAIGLGVCTNEHNYEWCKKECQSKYPNSGFGNCVKEFDQNICVCVYYN